MNNNNSQTFIYNHFTHFVFTCDIRLRHNTLMTLTNAYTKSVTWLTEVCEGQKWSVSDGSLEIDQKMANFRFLTKFLVFGQNPEIP